MSGPVSSTALKWWRSSPCGHFSKPKKWRCAIRSRRGKRTGHEPYASIGKDIPRTDARAKATGAAVYTDDMKLPGMLYGTLLRSPAAPRPDRQHRRQPGGSPARGQVRDHRRGHAQDQIRQLAPVSHHPGRVPPGGRQGSLHRRRGRRRGGRGQRDGRGGPGADRGRLRGAAGGLQRRRFPGGRTRR